MIGISTSHYCRLEGENIIPTVTTIGKIATMMAEAEPGEAKYNVWNIAMRLFSLTLATPQVGFKGEGAES